MELIAEKQKQDLNNTSSSEEVTDSVAVLQLEDPQGIRTLFADGLQVLKDQT